MDYDYGYDGSGAVIAAILGFYAIFFFIYLMVIVASYVVMGFALMHFFRKVGVEPWIAWVPVYNTWKVLEVGGLAGWYALLVFVPLGSYVTFVFHAIATYRIGKAFGKPGEWVVLAIFLPFVWAFLLGSEKETYRPETYAALGWPPPLSGFGSAPRLS